MDGNQKLKALLKAHSKKFKKFYQRGERNAQEILHVLQRHSNFTVSRIKIVGSIGLKSPLEKRIQPDFNLVVFANFKNLHFKSVLEDFGRCLVYCTDGNTEFESEWRTAYSHHFRMKDVTSTSESTYISFELLPAMNFLSSAEDHLNDRKKGEAQSERALQLISETPDPIRTYTSFKSCLAERYLYFIENQSRFVRHMIRLAKLWNRLVIWEGQKRLYGRSMIIELVAVAAATAEETNALEKGRKKCLLVAFRCFLVKFIQFQQKMFEIFNFPENSNLNLKCSYEEYVQETCSADGPLILDPVNPFNNLAKDIPSHMRLAFKATAKATLRDLHDLNTNPNNVTNSKLEAYFKL